jgi:hypothetical protein
MLRDPDPDPHSQYWIQDSQINADPDPQHCLILFLWAVPWSWRIRRRLRVEEQDRRHSLRGEADHAAQLRGLQEEGDAGGEASRQARPQEHRQILQHLAGDSPTRYLQYSSYVSQLVFFIF